MLARPAVTVAVAAAACAMMTTLAGCVGGGEPSSAGDVPVASDLAPSQLAATTVAAPATPPSCEPDVLGATARFDAASADVAVVTIRNGGAVTCEVDVSSSPSAGPSMEPDVWLEPGGAAELLVDVVTGGCDAPTTVSELELVVDGGSLDVELPEIEACRLTLSAFYTV